jgi:aminopeptidase N
VLLDYLSRLDGGVETAARHFKAATNMTDLAASLTVLAHRHPGSPQADAAIAAFAAKFASDPLVMDKWFQIQASVPGPQAVKTVRALMTHPAFSSTNPNRLRSLIGTFSSGNQTGFHRADGAGYRFFAETVLEIEKRNPQVAARLATALRSWRSLETGRQAKAREALLTMANTPNLSADLRDIIDRTLA